MESDFHRIGSVFQQKRKELGLSLKEVENSTSIRTSFLEAIEEGKSERLISSIYSHGFIRQYASFLGLDIDRLVQDFPVVFAKNDQKHEFAYGIGTLEMRGSMNGGVKWLPALVKALVIVGIGFAGYFFAKLVGVF